MTDQKNSQVIATLKSGTPVTEDIADELAAEAEAGYELTPEKRFDPREFDRPGRKSLAGGRGRSPRVNFRMTEELHRRAQERAELEGKTLSEVAREALERHVG